MRDKVGTCIVRYKMEEKWEKDGTARQSAKHCCHAGAEASALSGSAEPGRPVNGAQTHCDPLRCCCKIKGSKEEVH